MNQLVNSALLAYYSKTGKIKTTSSAKRRDVSAHSYDTMSKLERREFHQMLSELSPTQSVSIAAEEPDGTHYEYDRNLKATVKVTPDGERYPVKRLDQPLSMAPTKIRARLKTKE
jgi:hypothetical protein